MTRENLLTENKPRLEYMDAAKALAIVTVMLGHAVEYVSTSDYHHPLWAFIYSFHMPLFMIISGFFASSSLRLPLGRMLLKKGLQLVLPGMVWSVLAIGFIRFNVLNIFWFLSCLFICYALAGLGMRIFRHSMTAAALFSMVVALAFVSVVYVPSILPFFWAGIFLNRHKERWLQAGTGVRLGLWAAFIFLLLFWNSDYTVYYCRLHTVLYHGKIFLDPHEYACLLFRLVIGCTGSMAILLSLRRRYGMVGSKTRKRISQLGQATIGIYILQSLYHSYLHDNMPKTGSDALTFLFAPCLATALTLVCYGVYRLLRRNRLFDGLLFGGFRLKSRQPEK